MFKYTKSDIKHISAKTNFNSNTCEKVLRLYSIMNFFNLNGLSNQLVLKGGTAINLFVLDLPRLSVDIDLDFNLASEKSEMFSHRSQIDSAIKRFMKNEDYVLSEKSRFTHSLDSYVYSYLTTSGSHDILKIEINYSNRVHILKTITKESTHILGEYVSFNCLADDELIGSKINALLTRTTPRDIYDVFNLFKAGKITNDNFIRKIAIFYICLGNDIPISFENLLDQALLKIGKLNYQKIKESLLPVLQRGTKLNIEEMSYYVKNEISKMFILDSNDFEFIEEINHKSYNPKVLFQGYQTEDITNHPMGQWKTK